MCYVSRYDRRISTSFAIDVIRWPGLRVARLRRAIMNDDTNKICHILDSERHILFKDVDHDGNSPLMLAVRYASPVTIRVLLSLGAHPDALNLSNHQTSLTYLAELKCDDDNERSYEIAKTLLEADADVDKPRYTEYTDEHGNVYLDEETPLMIAIKNNNLRLAKLFCKNGANVNFARERTKIRPIHIAVAQGNSAMFDLLVNCGAKVKNVLTVDDNSLLHWFCFYRQNDNQLAIVKSLLEQGCDVDAGNSHRRTPLMLAARHGLIETIRILLHAGAKMDITDYKGYRAIDLAKQQNQMDCYQLLKQNSSNKDLTSRRRPVARQPIIHTTSEQKRVVPQKADSHQKLSQDSARPIIHTAGSRNGTLS
ncbi:unnamed protein product [Didymodactylos carnosus]|uniref:Uncharacterized protein n=1 Tax=Didymodactylos carnosus TaxID=1234261 RepID=A0A815ISN2_9BILA|nr:unnamed protein product [Didymodactylos carnosus]CAF1370458.1 unnamed protein product [Didymodactylos carnosus]CAF3864183.1 unnamed protein product [Didymodactylos carnosus]CAF4256365.1 unnamed protein product [Didymodactylos carnosus]